MGHTITHEWTNQHAASCQVTKDRANLLERLANDPGNPYLLGAVPEYDNGGDQEAENCDCGAYRRTVAIPVPYEGDQPLEVELTPDDSYHSDLLWMHNNMSEDEAPRIFTAATVLYHADAGSFAECLHTAIVWERG